MPFDTKYGFLDVKGICTKAQHLNFCMKIILYKYLF